MVDLLQTKISLFRGKNIRKVIFNNEWWFAIEDVVVALTDSSNPKDYITKMKLRDSELSKGYGQIVSTLPIQTKGGKQKMSCSNTEGVLRIIQSIPSSKAESLKRWLARVGYERIQEIEDPELAAKRMRFIYKSKGYPDSWIKNRMRGIVIREDLTDEWRNREIKLEREYAILTAEISKATFGMTPSQYKKFKNLKRGNLRDHMDEVELLFSMLGEVSTTRITQARDVKGFVENKKAAKDGGKIAGDARIALEKESKRKVSTKTNYLGGYKDQKLISH